MAQNIPHKATRGSNLEHENFLMDYESIVCKSDNKFRPLFVKAKKKLNKSNEKPVMFFLLYDNYNWIIEHQQQQKKIT